MWAFRFIEYIKRKDMSFLLNFQYLSNFKFYNEKIVDICLNEYIDFQNSFRGYGSYKIACAKLMRYK